MSGTIVNNKRNLSFIGAVHFADHAFKQIRRHPSLFIGEVLHRNLFLVFEASWVFGFSHYKNWNFLCLLNLRPLKQLFYSCFSCRQNIYGLGMPLYVLEELPRIIPFRPGWKYLHWNTEIGSFSKYFRANWLWLFLILQVGAELKCCASFWTSVSSPDSVLRRQNNLAQSPRLWPFQSKESEISSRLAAKATLHQFSKFFYLRKSSYFWGLIFAHFELVSPFVRCSIIFFLCCPRVSVIWLSISRNWILLPGFHLKCLDSYLYWFWIFLPKWKIYAVSMQFQTWLSFIRSESIWIWNVSKCWTLIGRYKTCNSTSNCVKAVRYKNRSL